MNTVTFKNKEGHDLHGKMEFPVSRLPHNFAIFAHCFTCNKNFHAVRNICNALTTKGFGVLRFDFTGLGESEGDFVDTNFSGNVEDLLSAAEFLKKNYQAPTLIIGHSLGGAAAYFAASQLQEVKAVATIGAPSDISHVRHLLKEKLEEIKTEGSATVNIGGRPFSIKKHFLEDLENKELQHLLPELNKAILIFHSPQDTVVGIVNAEELYRAAKHPKSFVSLDGGDHMISKKEDSVYVGEMIGTWAGRYLDVPEEEELQTKHEVAAFLGPEGFTTNIRTGHHAFIADEPIKVGGKDLGPTPYELISAGLAACTSMTIQMYAKNKGWNIEKVETHINYNKDYATDCLHCDDQEAKIDTFRREIVVKGELTPKQLDRILVIADKCPVHKTLHTPTQIISTLKEQK